MRKKFALSVMLISAVMIAFAYQVATVDQKKLKGWNPTSPKEQSVEKLKSVKEQRISKGHQAERAKAPKARVASTDKETLPYYIVDDGTRINFCLVNWFDGDFLGIGAIRPINDTPIECVRKGVAPNPSIYADGKLHSCSVTSGGGVVMAASYQQYDALTGQKLKDINLPAQWYSVFSDGAYNPVDGKIYVMGYDGGHSPYLAVLNPETGTYVNSWAVFCPVNVAAMAFDKNGTLYAITSSGELCTISLETGLGTTLFRVEEEGQNIYHWQTIAFDYHTGELFWMRSSSTFTTDLRRINIKEKNVEVISDLPNIGAVGAWIVSPEAPDKAPNTIQSLSAEFSGSATIGNILLTAPSTAFDSTPISGNLTIEVYVDDKSVKTIQVQAGQSAKIENYDFGTPGEHKLSAVVSNSAGKGPEGSVTAYCGVDKPLPVQNVSLKISQDGNATLRWEAPKSGIHAGYFDSSLLRYKVVRYPDKKTVAEDISATNFSEQLSNNLTKYYYEVTASMQGNSSDPVASNPVVFGDGLQIPFNSLLGDDMFDLNTIIDVDGDGNGWYETWGSISCTTAFQPSGYYSEDWLFTPPIQMEPGNYYIRTSYMYQSDTPCDFSITFGDAPEVNAQTQTVATVAPALNDFGEYPVEGYARVEKAGKYYVGFKMSATSQGSISTPYLTVFNLSIDKGAHDNAPAAVDDLSAKPFEKGQLKSTISFTAPSSDFAGNTLSSIDRIEICNAKDEVLGVLTDVQPGQQCSYVDEKAKQGYNTYRVFACNGYGRGMHNQTETYVGADIPDIVPSLKYQVQDNRILDFQWSAPGELGVRGGYVNPANLRYHFCRSEADYIEPFPVDNGRNLTDTKFTWEEEGNWEEDPQYLIYYGVKAVNNIGEGPLGYTSIVLGKPVDTPFIESFRSGNLWSMVWRIQSIMGESAWNITSGPTNDGILPSDKDGGMVHFLTVSSTPTQQALVTPLFQLKEMKNPVLIFDMYHHKDASSNASLSIQISSDDAPFEPIGDAFMVNAQESGWQTHTVSLNDFNGNDRLFIAFVGASAGQGASFAIDNIRICDNVDYDLEIESFTGPDNMQLEDTGSFTVKVLSKGVKDISDYSVEIYADGQKVGQSQGTPLKLGDSKDIEVEVTPTAAMANRDVEFEAKVCLDDDANLANNQASFTVAVGGTLLPAPTNFKANATSEDVELTWDRPDAPAPVKESESFEDYQPFAITGQGPWKFYDGDSLYPYGINGVEYPNMDQPRAFMIWAPASIKFDEKAWQPHSGNQCLIAFASSYMKTDGSIDMYEQSDEWLISPKVVGGTKVSFFASSPQSGMIEKIEFLASSTGRNPEDFTTVGSPINITTPGWNEYSFSLPQDAKYFAIRYVSRGADAFALLIDDIEYTAGYEAANLSGYNIYINGVRENSEIITGTQTRITCDYSRDNQIGVSALYAEGESQMTTLNIAAGTDAVVADDIVLKVEGDCLLIENAKDKTISIFDTAGRICYRIDRASGHDLIRNVANGIYIVNIGNRSYKVLISI